MQIISKIFASHAAALAALKAASPLFVSTDKDGEDHLSPCGLDADGARFDVIVTPLTTPGVGTVPGPEMPNGSRMPDMPAPPTPTGEVQVDLYWQGAQVPTIIGSARDALVPMVNFNPPLTEINPNPIPWLNFMALFTPTEQTAIALSTDPSVAVFRMMATGLGGDINLSDPRVSSGLDALIDAKLITSNRKSQILLGQITS